MRPRRRHFVGLLRSTLTQTPPQNAACIRLTPTLRIRHVRGNYLHGSQVAWRLAEKRTLKQSCRVLPATSKATHCDTQGCNAMCYYTADAQQDIVVANSTKGVMGHILLFHGAFKCSFAHLQDMNVHPHGRMTARNHEDNCITHPENYFATSSATPLAT